MSPCKKEHVQKPAESKREVINSKKAPKAIGPYSHSIKTGNFVFTSGQLGLNPDDGKLVTGGVEAETHQALKNLASVLESAGSNLGSVLKTTLFVKNMDDFPKINKIYGEFFPENPPARSTVEVARLPMNGLFEIEAIAVID